MDPIRWTMSRLADAARCDEAASPSRSWCLASKFPDAHQGALPIGKTLVGYTVQLDPDDNDDDAALAHKVQLAALAIGGTDKAPTAKILQVTPGSAAERALTAQAIAALTLVFEDQAASAPLPPALVARVKALTASYEVTSNHGYAWAWSGRNVAELKQLGKYWVVVETAVHPVPAPGTRHSPYPIVWVTILTDAWT